MKKIIALMIVLVIAISPLFRGLYFAMESAVFLAVIALLALLYLFTKLNRKEPIRYSKWHLALGSLLVAACLISFISAVNARENINTLIQFTEYFIVSLLLYDYYKDSKQQFGWTIMLTTVISGFLNAIIGIEALTQAFNFLKDTLNGSRIGATFQYANTASVYFVVCLLFALTLINLTDKLPVKILLAGMGSTIFLAMLLTGSRGGYIVGFFVLVIYILIQPSKNRLKTFGMFICMAAPVFILINKISQQNGSKEYLTMTKYIAMAFFIAVILALIYEILRKALSGLKIKPAFYTILFLTALTVIAIIIINKGFSAILPEGIIKRFERFAELGFNDRNVYLRLMFDKWALILIRDNWLLGVGGGGWNSLYYSVQDFFFAAKLVHNHYFQVFLESGILGFLSFSAITLFSLWFMLRSLFKMKDIKRKLLLTGLLCGFLSLAIHSSFDFNLSFASISLVFWAMIAASAVFANGDEEKKDQGEKIIMPRVRNGAPLALIIVCSVLISFNSLYAASAYYGDKGDKAMVAGNYALSQQYYTQAMRLDQINPVYYAELAKLYNYFAQAGRNKDETTIWLDKARQAAERSVQLDAYFPNYRETLVKVYFNSGMPVEALENAEMLIKYQPCKSSNYELLAKGYVKAAAYYIENNNPEQAKELLILCSNINNLPYVEDNDIIKSYRQEADILLKNIGE
jgi:O-antigen ligase